MALAARSPRAGRAPCRAAGSSGIVLLLDEQVVRQLARREQLERAREAVGVVDERAGDHELVQQDAVRVELRPGHARADEHERARALELRERRLPARGRCPSTRARRRTARRRGRTASPASRARRGRRCGRRASRTARAASPCGSLTTMSSTPSALSAATDRNPIGPPPVTSQRVPGRAPPAWVMPCSATASGSTSAACLSERSSGTRSASAAPITL